MRERASLLLTLAAVAFAYATALSATFQFDDFHLVVRNPDVQAWSAWAASMPGIRPLTKASLTLSWMLSPMPAAFVAFSLCCHAASAALMLALARRWLAALAPGQVRAEFAALVAALMFALHPAQTEAVTYIAGRSVALSGVLYLAALLAYERARGASRVAPHLALSMTLFALALAARETAWTLPFALVLLEVARGTPLRAAMRRAGPHLGVLVLALAAMAASPVYRRLLAASLEYRPPAANLFAQVEAIAYQVTHPLLTLRVNFDPDLMVSPSADFHWWLAALAIVSAVVVSVLELRRRPWLGFGLLWFLLQLAPTNGPIARFDLVNDRELYLALAGPALIVGILVAKFRPPIAGTVAAVVLAGYLGIATAVRNTDYASEIALWEATVRASPRKARAWNNLGYAWQLAGDGDRARAAYERALRVDPGYAKAQVNLDRLQSAREPGTLRRD